MLDFRVSTFLTVCQTLNYTKAAGILGLTQPAVTHHIHHLERYYGVKLFHYAKKSLSMTEAGKILYERLNAVAKDQHLIQKELLSAPEAFPLISIGVTRTIGEYAIVSPVASYLAAHPDVNMHLHYGNTRELLTLLDKGTISLALIEGYYPKEKYLHKKYLTEEFACVSSARHVFKNGEPNQLTDLLSERLVIREKGSGTRNLLERFLSVRGMTTSDFSSFLEIENMHTLIQLLLADCGISFLYRIAAEEELKKGTLREIQLADFSLQHDFNFVYEKNSIYSRHIERLIEELV